MSGFWEKGTQQVQKGVPEMNPKRPPSLAQDEGVGSAPPPILLPISNIQSFLDLRPTWGWETPCGLPIPTKVSVKLTHYLNLLDFPLWHSKMLDFPLWHSKFLLVLNHASFKYPAFRLQSHTSRHFPHALIMSLYISYGRVSYISNL